MERIIKVSSFEYSLTHCSAYYINKYDEYGLECCILSVNLGVLWDKYTLRLKGKPENIQLFIDYLRAEGFKVR